MKDDDKACYAAFLEGDNSGFESLVIRYKDNLIFFISRYVNDLDMAEDLAQDAFVEVYMHKERYDMTGSFKTYLFTIGRNKAVDYIRHNRNYLNSQDIAEVEIPADELTLEQKVISNETGKEVRAAVRLLKKEEQALIDLAYFEQLSCREIGEILGHSESNVKVKLHRARKHLAKLIEKDY